jgi:phosphoribosylformylglycinamidine synthase
MSRYIASIKIMPHKELLDPQGKTVARNLKNIDIHSVQDVRIGKQIDMVIEASNQQEAEQITELACKKLLANLIMETYEFTVNPA